MRLSGLAALVLLSGVLVTAEAKDGFRRIPVPRGLRRSRCSSPKQLLEKSSLGENAKMVVSLALDLACDEGSKWKTYKTGKPVAEVMKFYQEYAKQNFMDDIEPDIYDNSDGKKDKDGKKDSAGSISLSVRDAKGRICFTVAAFREEKSRTTTVFIILTAEE